MVNQKPICFKIDLKNLEDIDDIVHNSCRWTTRNAELNRAVSMYIELKNAITSHNYEGDPSKLHDWIKKHLHRSNKIKFL